LTHTVDAILHHSTNLGSIRWPQIRWDECRRLPLQQLDCLACTVLLEYFTR